MHMSKHMIPQRSKEYTRARTTRTHFKISVFFFEYHPPHLKSLNSLFYSEKWPKFAFIEAKALHLKF